MKHNTVAKTNNTKIPRSKANTKSSTKGAVNRDRLARLISNKAGIGTMRALKLIDSIVVTQIEQLNQGHRVTVRGLGSFHTRQKRERIGRNPKTMQEVMISARKVLRFKPAITLRQKINSNVKSVNRA